MAHSSEPGFLRTDVSPSEFEVGASTSEEEVEKKEIWSKRVPKSPLTAVFESWLLSILHCTFLIISVAQFPYCLQVMPERFREFPEMKMC